MLTKKAGKQEGLLNPIDRSEGPLNTYHVDHLGPMPSSAKEFKHIFVVVDGFTKFVWLYPVKNTGAAEVIKKLKAQGDVFGAPARIVSDRGAAFTSNDFKEFCAASRIQHILTTTGVARGNGWINGIIVPALTKLSIADPMKWYRHVADLQRFINSTQARSTKRTPFKLMFGVEMRNQEDVTLADQLEEALPEKIETERDNERTNAMEAIRRIQDENRKAYDKQRKAAQLYAVGDLVAIKRTQFATGAKVQQYSTLGRTE